MHLPHVLIREWSYWLTLTCLTVSVHAAFGDVPSDCEQDGRSLSYLEVAVDMIIKAKTYYPVCAAKKGNFNRSKDYFYKDWVSYKNGFGDIEKDFWLGNDNIFSLTNQRLYSVRVELKASDGEKRFALYDMFWIDDENNKYTLHIQDYRGDAGDSLHGHNKVKFSTKDQDNDSHETNCAQTYKGGWWYHACHSSNLNGLYLDGKHESYADGVEWFSWRGHNDSMVTTEIKIRPKGFRSTSMEETPMRR